MKHRRIPNLDPVVLALHSAWLTGKIRELEINVSQHRHNPSEAGATHQIKEVAELREHKETRAKIDAEIKTLKDAGKWDPQPAREVVARDKPPQLPQLNPVHEPSGATFETFEDKEIPIKVIDKDGRVRAWLEKDGPIHGPTPADTIVDVSKTSNKK